MRIPNNQTTSWFTVCFTTPGLRARFELLDVASGRIELGARRLRDREEQAAVVRAAALVRGTWQRSAGQLSNMEQELALLAQRPRAQGPYIGHSHIDMNWLWTSEDTNNVICRDFKSVV